MKQRVWPHALLLVGAVAGKVTRLVALEARAFAARNARYGLRPSIAASVPFAARARLSEAPLPRARS